MGWKDGLDRPYHIGAGITQQQILSITPNDVARYMKLQAYGTATPTINDRPVHMRAYSLEYLKKALSYFHPHKNAHWNVESSFGNPTRSVVVNDLIKMVRKHEVRKQGARSRVKRDITKDEHIATLKAFEKIHNDDYKQRQVPTMLKLHVNIIGRTDDICQLKSKQISSHHLFSDKCLETQVAWSKNVMDERECPPQIIFGAADVDFCVHASMACHLESNITDGVQGIYLFGQPDRDDDDEPYRANDRYTSALRNMWKKNVDLTRLIAQTKGELGSHSERKFGTTWATRNGCTDHEAEIRGRWRGKRGGSIVNRYINPDQLPTDAKVAAILCVGGPVTYKVKPDSGVTEQFMREFVVPGMTEYFADDPSNRIADVLGPALLWVCLQDGLEHMVSGRVRDRIQRAWNIIKGNRPNNYNPVEKVPLMVYRVENQVVVEEIGAGERVAVEAAGGNINGWHGDGRGVIGPAGNAANQQINQVTIACHRIEREIRRDRQRMFVS